MHHGGQALVEQRGVLVKERVEQRLVPRHEAAEPVKARATERKRKGTMSKKINKVVRKLELSV